MKLLLHADASRNWEPAAIVAARLARATGGAVTVLTSERVKRRQQEVARRAEQVLGLPKGQMDVEARGGLVEHVVPEAAQRGNRDLLVLAPLGGLDWLTHGHILGRIVAHTPCSVLLARGGAVGYTRALVATEGPGHGAKDLDAALALAAVFDMEVHALHVLSQIDLLDRTREAPEADFLAGDHEIAAHLRELRARIAQAHVKGDASVRTGPVQDEILAEVRAGSFDLLVIGAHGLGDHRDEDALLTRDIAGWLIRHCPVSVLVVREPWPAPAAERRP